MRVRHPLFITIVVLLSCVSGYTLYQGSSAMEAHASPLLNTMSTQTLPSVDVRRASAKVKSFHLLSNNPPIPDIEMYDEDSKTLTFARFKGKVVLFNLWATWCPPCIREMPGLNALQAQYKDQGFVVVPVASGEQGQEEPAEFLRTRGLNELTTYYDPYSQFLSAFNLDTLPTTLVIDRDGNMRGGVMGILDWNSTEAKALIEAFLNENKT